MGEISLAIFTMHGYYRITIFSIKVLINFPSVSKMLCGPLIFQFLIARKKSFIMYPIFVKNIYIYIFNRKNLIPKINK